MTGEEVMVAAQLMNRYRQLHLLRFSLASGNMSITEVAQLLAGDPILETAKERALVAMTIAADKEVERLLGVVDAEADKLRIKQPFPDPLIRNPFVRDPLIQAGKA